MPHNRLIKLIGELAKRKDCSQVYIQKSGMTLAFGEKATFAGLILMSISGMVEFSRLQVKRSFVMPAQAGIQVRFGEV